MSDKTYINGIYIKEIIGQYGSFFNVSIDVDAFGASIQPHIFMTDSNKKKVNLTISKRKEPGKYGDTHYCVLNEYKPKESEPSNSVEAPERTGSKAISTKPDDDLPF